MTEPLIIQLEVACPVEHSFRIWTERIGTWWPADHTVSGRADAQIILEPRLGGRIFERLPDGAEHDWGEISLWEPPHRFGYLWHLRRDRVEATDVVITFVAEGAGTRVGIAHTGWERLGGEADVWRDRNRMGWTTLLPHFTAALD